MSGNVLVVEDDEAVRELLALHLERAGFNTIETEDATAAWERLGEADVVVLDWMLPGMLGVELLQRIRQNGSFGRVPVLMLTARASEMDSVTGLESGADDYLVKPFSTPELVARLRALLRRTRMSEGVEGEELELGELHLNDVDGTATLAGRQLHLTRREFDLLHYLAAHPGRVFSRTELLDRVWGRDFLGTERTVDQHIAQLRASIGSEWLETVRGRGYRLVRREG